MTDVSVTLRPPCLCPSEGHKHGVPIQSSINLGDTFLQITREWKTPETWFLARLFIYPSSIVSQTLDSFHWMVTIFILITWLVKTENWPYVQMFRLALSSHIYFLFFKTPIVTLCLLAPLNTCCGNAWFGEKGGHVFVRLDKLIFNYAGRVRKRAL